MAHRPVLVLAVFVDAFGWRIAGERPRPFLDGLLVERRPLRTVFGYSATCVPSVLSGLDPRDHGHFSFFRYDPAASPFRWMRPLGLLPRSVTRRGRVRSWISRGLKPLFGYTGYFQIYNVPFEHLRLFDYTEKRDLYQPGGINSGAPTFLDHLRAHRQPFWLADWQAAEATNLAALDAQVDQGQIDFAYLYLARLDGILHDTGTRSRAAAAHIDGYESALRAIVDKARRRYGEVRVHLFSDHGMADIHDLCDLRARVEPLGLGFGHDYVAMYDSTMARFWFLRPGAEARIREALAGEPRGRWLDDDTLRAWGCDFPGRSYGHIFLLDPGVLLVPSFMGETALAGMHGYDPDHEDSVAQYGASVRVDAPPGGLTDLADLLRAEADYARAAQGRS